MTGHEKETENRVWTIPNILTMFRIALIPIFVFLYLKGQYVPSLIVVGLSALSDILDGLIARKFNMVTSLGKALDPIADKLSQFALMLCLLRRFWPQMLIPVVIIVVKELTTGIVALVTVKKTKAVHSAVWHGKLTTVFLYAMMMLHVIWYGITPAVSWITVLAASAMMLVSFVLYNVRYFQILSDYRKEEEARKANENENELPDPAAAE